jgi:hypothetical protein
MKLPLLRITLIAGLIWGPFPLVWGNPIRPQAPAYEVLEGKFEQTKTLKEMGISLKSQGAFRIYRLNEQAIKTSQNPAEKGRKLQSKLEWMIEKPAKTNLCLDSTNLVVSGAENFKGSIDSVGSIYAAQIRSLQKLLSLDPSTPTDLKLEVLAKNPLRVKVLPEDQALKNYRYIELSFLKENSLTQKEFKNGQAPILSKVQLVESGGDELQMIFSKVTRSPSLNLGKNQELLECSHH